MKTKVLQLWHECYLFPDSITNIDDFLKWVNVQEEQFVPLKSLRRFADDESGNQCAFPYFIEDFVREEYLNFARVEKIAEIEVIILPREEYDKRIKLAFEEKCVNCINYSKDKKDCTLSPYRGYLSPDGNCFDYEENVEE